MVLKFMKLEYHGKIFEFMELEYHEKLDFAKLEYPKSDRSLHISKTVVDSNIVCKKCVIWLFSLGFKCGFSSMENKGVSRMERVRGNFYF